MTVALFRIEDVFARLKDRVTDLAGRIDTASAFARLVEHKQLPQQTPAAFVLPGSISGGLAQLASGLFRQAVTETVSIVLCVRVAGDARGDRSIDEITPLLRSVVGAICGWAPANCPGQFVLLSGQLVGTQDSCLVYQLDFSLDDQLRIIS